MANTPYGAWDPLHNETSYRKRAHEIREIATKTQDADARRDLLALALGYDQLAERAKRMTAP